MTENHASVKQLESMDLKVIDSRNVTVCQTSVELVSIAQKSINAAIQLVINLCKHHNVEVNVKALQKIMQDSFVGMKSAQGAVVFNSYDVKVTQTESELAHITQKAIDLLAQTIAKITHEFCETKN